MYIEKLKKEITYQRIKEKLQLFPDDIVYFGGSLIEGEVNKYSKGMGNIYSDLDMFIIRENNKFNDTHAVYSDSNKRTTFIRVNGVGIDVEIFNRDIIEDVIFSINKVKFNLNERIDNLIDSKFSLQEINTFLCRLKYSKAFYNEEEYRVLKERINFIKFLKVYKESLYNLWDNKLDDTLGNIEEKQLDVALYCCRLMFIDFSKYYLVENNEFIDRDKWVFLKVINLAKNVNNIELIKNYNLLFCSEVDVDEKKERVIKSSISYMKKIMESSSLEELI